MAYVADRTTEKERSGIMALMGSAFAVSGIIGPALASQAILLDHWFLIFFSVRLQV